MSKQKHGRRWTEHTIIQAIQAHAEQHGRPPTAGEWQNGGDHPSYQTLRHHFNSFSDAIWAAGYPPPKRGHPYTPRNKPRGPYKPKPRLTISTANRLYRIPRNQLRAHPDYDPTTDTIPNPKAEKPAPPLPTRKESPSA